MSDAADPLNNVTDSWVAIHEQELQALRKVAAAAKILLKIPTTEGGMYNAKQLVEFALKALNELENK